MNVAWGLILGVLLTGMATAVELAPEYEVDRLMLSLEEHLEAKAWTEAEADIQALEALKPAKPADFHFLKARVEKQAGRYEQAREALIRYINEAGRDGKHYRDALRELNALDAMRQQTAASASGSAEGGAGAPPALPAPEQAETQAWLARIQSLYLKSAPIPALVEHANALLAAAPVLPGRLRHLNRNEGVVYSVSVSERKGEILIRKSDYTRNPARHDVESLSVYGVNPYLNAGCSEVSRTCWIWHPVHADQKWVEMGPGGNIRELQRTLSELIRQLQS